MKKALTLGLLPLLVACSQIDTGNIGVESSLGQYKLEELPPGVYFTLFKAVHEISVKENAVALQDMKPKSRDNLTMADFDIDLYFRVDPAKAADLMVKYAGDLAKPPQGDGLLVGQGLIVRQAREASYKAAATFAASEMHTKRTEIAAQVQERLQQELDKDAGPGAFVITNVIVRNIVTDPALEEAIKEAGKAEFQIKRKEQEIALAKAEAERKRVEAEGQARANRIIAESLTPQLVRLREIEATAQFAKQGTHTVLMGGNGTALVNVSK